ncbi:MAG TPA: hypothetical protein VGE37_16910 [Archangium sp.]
MIRLLVLMLAVVPAAVWADPPNFSHGGFLLQLQYGPGFWTFDKSKLDMEVAGRDPGGGTAFVDSLVNTHTVTLGLNYNILGHATIGADLTASGWRLDAADRGGGGMLVGKVAWHPLELVFMNKEKRPIPLDFSTFFGVGYGIVGGGRIGDPRGMDGLLFEWGADVQWYFARFFGIGFFVRGVFFNWDKLYQDFNNKVFVQLSQPSGGSFWTVGITLTFRAGD